MENKKVSVAMATYNGEKYIREQILSILKNLKEDDEVIISDDGSTDNTILILNSIGDKRIKIFPGPKKGFVKNFENAIKMCSGDYIYLADQDDIWLPNKVERVNLMLQKYYLVCHNAFIMQENDITKEKIQDSRGKHKSFFMTFYKNSYIGCCMAFRKEIVNLILPFPNNLDVHDWFIGVIANKKYGSYFLNEPLIYYRRHNTNTIGLNKHTLKFKVKKRIQMIGVYIKWLLFANKSE